MTTRNGAQNDNRVRLKVLMAEHDLNAADVAAMLDVSVHTVNSWRSRGGVPGNLLELLEYKLADGAAV